MVKNSGLPSCIDTREVFEHPTSFSGGFSPVDATQRACVRRKVRPITGDVRVHLIAAASMWEIASNSVGNGRTAAWSLPGGGGFVGSPLGVPDKTPPIASTNPVQAVSGRSCPGLTR